MSKQIHYEQPLNERIRTLLRLEDLFSQTRHNLNHDSVWDSRATLTSLIEIMNIFERGDLKSEVIKELERHAANLQKLQKIPDVDVTKLQSVLDELQKHIKRLAGIVGKVGQRLRNQDLISTVRQRLTIPGGTCNFDLPVYHYWLKQPFEQRASALEQWLSEFEPVEHALRLLLRLTRDSASPQSLRATSGFYQKPLEPSNPCQLVRISLNNTETVFPEVSGGKHRISVRFLDHNHGNKPKQVDRPIDFQLSCCSI